MRYLKAVLMCLVAGGWLAGAAYGQTYMPFEYDGQSVRARPVSFKDTHIQLALESGGYTNIPWGRLSQSTLKSLLPMKNYGAYAKPFIDESPSTPPVAPKIQVKEVERMSRPEPGSITASAVMWMFFFMMYAGNIYAGYEIASYRQRNPAMVCLVSAIAPVIGPILFLAMPPVVEKHEEVEEVVEEVAPVLQMPVDPEVEAAAAAAPAAPQFPVTVFQRGQTTFNRRFFETKLAGFLKVVPGDAEKDMLIAVKSSRGNYVGTKLTRVAPNEITLHVVAAAGGASQDVMIPYTELMEVTIRHKDAPVS